ncbi:12371_t:CDS:2 [Ambispora gerdemannii]|uniref:12371_t:CDS:1 n=1 Tax=Ambispora gerdemannii TaxID=144530 RepID=A0A9N8V1A5_9GLOM|nr:12371_t:CDS:2 [Ambispora gerdemannii]
MTSAIKTQDFNSSKLQSTFSQNSPSVTTESTSHVASIIKKENTAPIPTNHTNGVSNSITSSISTTKTTVSSKNMPSSTPAINIFSNDGSFLDRFKKMKAEEDEKKKQREALESSALAVQRCDFWRFVRWDTELMKKKAFEDRIRNRGKRKSPPTEDVDQDPKRTNVEVEDNETLDPKANAYLKEMQKYNERLCKDDSGHVRPLVK